MAELSKQYKAYTLVVNLFILFVRLVSNFLTLPELDSCTPNAEKAEEISGYEYCSDLAVVNRRLHYLQQWMQSQSQLLATINSKLDQLLVAGHRPEAQHVKVSLMEIFPLGTGEDFDKVENNLRDASFQAVCIKMICMTGGRRVKNAVQNILRKLLNDTLAMQFSFKGKSTKRCFCDTLLYKTIKHVFQRIFRDADDDTLKIHVSEWLVQAKFRKERREVRANKSVLSTEGNEQNDDGAGNYTLQVV